MRGLAQQQPSSLAPSWENPEASTAFFGIRATHLRWINAAIRVTRPSFSAAALLIVLTLLLLLTPWRSRPPSASDVVRFAVHPPEGTVFTGSSNATVPVPQFALSPDGRVLVFAAGAVGDRPMLWLRSIKEVTAHLLPGTEDANGPFWSPDGPWVAFFAEGKLKKIPAAGGAVQLVADGVAGPAARGGSWGRDDAIIFAYGDSSINRVPAAGGPIAPVNETYSSYAERAHRWPQFLPDGRHFLFTIRGGERRGLFAGSLKTRKFLVPFESSALYAPPGYLLFVDGNTLLGQSFDPDRLDLSGEPFTVAERVGRATTSQQAPTGRYPAPALGDASVTIANPSPLSLSPTEPNPRSHARGR